MIDNAPKGEFSRSLAELKQQADAFTEVAKKVIENSESNIGDVALAQQQVIEDASRLINDYLAIKLQSDTLAESQSPFSGARTKIAEALKPALTAQYELRYLVAVKKGDDKAADEALRRVRELHGLDN